MVKETWFEIFSKFTNPIFTKKDFQLYKKLAVKDLKFYGKYVERCARILDIGCGIGCTAVPLSVLGYKIVGIDNDKKTVEAARQNAKSFGDDIKILYGDAFDMNKLFRKDSFDACISGGLLEHFDEDKIRKLVRLQLKLAPTVLADMPVKTKATMKHYEFTEENAIGNISPNGVYRNFWSEDYWVNTVFKNFKVIVHITHQSIWGFDELYVVIKR